MRKRAPQGDVCARFGSRRAPDASRRAPHGDVLRRFVGLRLGIAQVCGALFMHRSIAATVSSSPSHLATHADRLAAFRWFLVTALATLIVSLGAGQAWGQSAAARGAFATGQI